MITIEEAKARGYTVDRLCYPHFGYKGPRFAPTEYVYVFTDLEAKLYDFISKRFPIDLDTTKDTHSFGHELKPFTEDETRLIYEAHSHKRTPQ